MVDISLLLLVVGFIVLAVLIFKFIKRVLYAVLSLVGLVILIVGAIFGVVFLDYQYLTSQENVTLHLVYAEGKSYALGTSLPIREQQPQIEEMQGLDSSKLDQFSEDVSKEDGIVIAIDASLFRELVVNETFSPPLEGASALEGQYNLQLRGEEVLQIMEAEDGVQEMLDILFAKNNVTNAQRELAESTIRDQLQTELDRRDLTMKEALFAYALQDVARKQEHALALMEGFKQGDLEVLPERFTYKLLRLLPASTLKNAVDDRLSG